MTKKIHAKKNRRKKKKNLGANIDEGFDNTSEEHFSNSYGFNANWRQSGQSASSSESEYSDSESAQLDQMKYVTFFCCWHCQSVYVRKIRVHEDGFKYSLHGEEISIYFKIHRST